MDEIASRADALMGAEKWDEAEDYLLHCLREAREQQNTPLELSLCSELMGFFRMRGKRDEALPVIERGLALLDEVNPAPKARGTILINAATALSSFGCYERALALYSAAEAVYRGTIPPVDPLYAALYNNMASAYIAAGDGERAEQSMEKALHILQCHPHHPDVATTYVNLAMLYAAADGEDPRVGACLDRAMERFNDPETLWDPYYAHTARKCAGAFEALGRPRDGQELRERADLIYEGT